MNLQSWGKAGGWTAIAAGVALLGVLVTWTRHRDQDQKELLHRVSALERSSIWVEMALSLMAQHDGIVLPPRPARGERPDRDPALDGPLAAEACDTCNTCNTCNTVRTEGDCP